MNTRQKDNEPFYHRSAYAGHEDIHKLSRAGWTYARVVLFTAWQYPEAVQQKVRSCIFNFLAGFPEPYNGYMEFCIRVTLAAAYIRKHNKGYMPICPQLWFDPGYTEGYLRTGLLYKDFLEKPVRHNRHTRHWKPLAEAILDTVEEGTGENFNYWASWFTVRRAWVPLCYFITAHLFHHYKNSVYA